MLAQAEFSYNNSMNRKTRKTPFEIVTKMKPRGLLDLRDIVGEEERSVEGKVFVDYMNSSYKEVKLKLKQSNHKCNENADKRRRLHVLKLVMK